MNIHLSDTYVIVRISSGEWKTQISTRQSLRTCYMPFTLVYTVTISMRRLRILQNFSGAVPSSKSMSSEFLSFIIILYSYCVHKFDAFPRWSGLNHFCQVTNISLRDGNKFQDISKVCLIDLSTYFIFLHDYFNSNFYSLLIMCSQSRRAKLATCSCSVLQVTLL